MFGPEELLVIGLICGGPLLSIVAILFFALRTRKKRRETPMTRCKFCHAPLQEGAGQASILELKQLAISWAHANSTDWAWKNGPRCRACLKSLQKDQRPEWLRELDAQAAQMELDDAEQMESDEI